MENTNINKHLLVILPDTIACKISLYKVYDSSISTLYNPEYRSAHQGPTMKKKNISSNVESRE